MGSCWMMVPATHPDCSIVLYFQEREDECLDAIRSESQTPSPNGQRVLIYRNCTEVGWSPPSPPYYSACELEAVGNNNTEDKASGGLGKGYFITMKVLYTCGYSTSLVALLLAVAIFSCFRKLHCTRNSIHIHFFTSFILRGAAVLIKDAVLFSDDSADHCTMSTVKCKASIAFVQYSVLANFYWLLVEGMYLQTLLLLTFTSDRSYIWWYILIGWGEPCNPNPSRGSWSPSQELG
ncbi:UNVERIFIED_CONTAM: hypothetical protein H355_009894 [Colinus virginianus]|nr:hypothetical protein H355_009894 [Colinus virginianus]